MFTIRNLNQIFLQSYRISVSQCYGGIRWSSSVPRLHVGKEKFELEEYFEQWEFKAKYLLCSSDCETFTISDILNLEPDARSRFEKLTLGYTEPPGNPTLRKEISKLYKDMGPEDIVVHTGAQEAIQNFIWSLESTDHLITTWPAYQSLLAQTSRAEVSYWKIVEDQGWKFKISDLKKLIRSNTKAIIINSPHNPTGAHIPYSDYMELNQICKEHNIILFSDEVYRDLEYDPHHRLPAACDLLPQSCSISVMSKSYGLAGLRIGWIASKNHEILEKLVSMKHFTTICNNAPSQFLAEVALRHRHVLVDRNNTLTRQNLEILSGFFSDPKYQTLFSWNPPIAGPTAFPKFLLGKSSESFCQELLDHSNVLLLPGRVYQCPQHFRIGFGRINFPVAFSKFKAFVDQYKAKH